MQLPVDLQEHIIYYFSRFYRPDVPQVLRELLLAYVEKNISVGFYSRFIENVTPLLELCEMLEYLYEQGASSGLINPAMKEDRNEKNREVMRRYKPLCEP